VETRLNLGLILADRGRIPEAIDQYEEALRLRPAFAEAHNALGLALVRDGRVPEALEHFAEASRIKPDFEDARVNALKAREALARQGSPPAPAPVAPAERK
jgi:tetratricopeptide (TPR) repeat protein